MEALDPQTVKYIICVGLGFGFGIFFTIHFLDKKYKEVMGMALDEIHRQYKRALEIMRKRYGLEREKQNEGENNDTQKQHREFER